MQEKKLVAEIKKTAKTGNEASLSVKNESKSVQFSLSLLGNTNGILGFHFVIETA